MEAKKTYKISDISVIIPTYNRPNEMAETLKSLSKFTSSLKEIIIVDQSKDPRTRELVKKYRNKKIRYVFSKTPSITIARNLGVKKSSKTTKIICFLDDDVTLHKNYFNEIIKIFNEHPEAKGVAGKDPTGYTGKESKIINFVKKIFFLGHFERDRARIVSAHGNTYPQKLKKTITAHWIPGVNMVYKREVFNFQKFDENLLGYTVVEDMDFSYRLHKRHPNSIFITPYAKLIHRVSQTARNPKKRLAYINQVDHFYFNFKDFNSTIGEKAIFIWSLIGIFSLRALSLLSFRKKNYYKFRFFLSALLYCLSNLRKIKKGKVREFD